MSYKEKSNLYKIHDSEASKFLVNNLSCAILCTTSDDLECGQTTVNTFDICYNIIIIIQ